MQPPPLPEWRRQRSGCALSLCCCCCWRFLFKKNARERIATNNALWCKAPLLGRDVCSPPPTPSDATALQWPLALLRVSGLKLPSKLPKKGMGVFLLGSFQSPATWLPKHLPLFPLQGWGWRREGADQHGEAIAGGRGDACGGWGLLLCGRVCVARARSNTGEAIARLAC